MSELAAPLSDRPGDPTVSADQARKAHSTVSGIKTAGTVWYALLGSLAAWIIHLLSFVSLAELSTTSPTTRWAMHGITVVTLTMTAAAIALSVRLARPAGDTDGRDEPARNRFLGQMGIVIGVINGLLILLEELYLNIIRRSGVA